jgi:hypothetical protein
MAIRSASLPPIVILLGSLSGSVLVSQEPTLKPVAQYYGSISNVLVADLKSANAPDIIGLDNNSNSLVVMLNLGNGTYGPPNYYGLDGQPNGIAVGDFNGDGKLDVAVALGTYNASSGFVAVLLNADHGMLHKPVYYKVPIPANSIAVADFNNDNLPDIAVIGNKDNNGTNTVAILTNTGSSFTGSSFAATVYLGPMYQVPDSDYVSKIVAGDFNGDGRIDLAYDDEYTQGAVPQDQIVILANSSSGWLATAPPLGPSGVTQIMAADIDGDGITDLVVPFSGCHTPCSGVEVAFMDKNFSVATFLNLDESNFGEQPYTPEVVVGDFNNDGRSDIATFAYGGADLNFNPLPPGIMMWTASGTRTFNAPKYYNQPNPASQYDQLYIAEGFLYKDGKRDLIVPIGSDPQVWKNTTNNPADPCPYPTSGGVHVCAPAADVPSGTVNFLASARTNTQPLLRFELWIDGKRRIQLTTDRMNVKLPVPDGAHEAVFEEVGASGLHIKKTVQFKVGN